MNNHAHDGHEHDDKHMFLLAGDATIFAHHLAMFHMANHQYELLLKITLPEAVKRAYLDDLKDNPASYHGAQIPQTHATVLPPIGTGKVKEFTARLIRLTPQKNGSRKSVDITPGDTVFKVTVEKVLRYRHLLREKVSRPKTVTYLLFGEGQEAHIAHQLTVPKDYDQLIRLSEVPAGVNAADLAAGVKVSIPSVEDTSTAEKTFENTPLTARSYEAVREDGRAGKITLKLGAQRWWNHTTLNPTAAPAQPVTAGRPT